MCRWRATVLTVLVVGLAFAAGCGTNQPAPGPEGAGQPKVNRVIMALPLGTETNDIITDRSTVPVQIQMRPNLEFLIGYDAATGKLVPQLASAWSVESEKNIRLKLRKGVPFHWGSGEFSAKDVIHTHQIRTAETATHYNTEYFRNIVDRIEVVSDDEVVIRLKDPDAEFLLAISEITVGGEIESKVNYDAAGKRPTLVDKPIAGTGPYQFKERAQGQYIRYERVPYQHWRATPDFPEFEFRIVSEASTRMAALLTGEVHISTLPGDLQKQAEVQGMKVIAGKVAGLRGFLRNHCCQWDEQKNAWVFPDSPLMDLRVRKALDKAINRDEINKAFFDGKGELMVNAHHHPSREGWNPDWTRRFQDEYGYDLNRARQLLSEAGYSAGKPLKTNIFSIQLAAYSGAPELAEVIANYWRAVGVDVQLLTVDDATRSANSRAFKYDNHWEVVGTSSNIMLSTRFYNSNSQASRLSGYNDKEMDALSRQISSTMDDRKRDELQRQWANLAFERHANGLLFWLPAEATVNPMFVEDWLFPGSISGTWTHVENIKAR